MYVFLIFYEMETIMISKEEARQKLRKMGYEVVEDGSVITILISSSIPLKNVIKDLKEKLLEMDYTASFGIKQYKGKSEETKEETKEEQEMIDLLNEESVQFSLEDFGMGF